MTKSPDDPERLRQDTEAAKTELGVAPPAAPRDRGTGAQSSATAELMERLAASPKLDHERYQLEGEIDRGGMGAILKIHDGHLNRRLAMKVLLEREAPRDAHGERLMHQLLGRFLEEAQVTSQLEHPGVVPVHELGLDQNGKAFFTMRLVQGRTAGVVFHEVHGGGTEWTLTRALEVMLRVCDTMAFAHDRGILHRDLKPDNVMVGRFGEVYVMDWGLAKILGQPDQHDLRMQPGQGVEEPRIDSVRGGGAEESSASVLSMDGQRLGTPSYMSPEQSRSEELDQRADVYSIGAMLYELLSGRAPYTVPGERRNAFEILKELDSGPPTRIDSMVDGVPAELVSIADRAMARDRDERYGDVAALAADLRAYLDHRAVQAHQTGAVVELKLWVRRNRPLAASLLAAALILVGGVIVSAALARRNATLAQAETDAKNTALEESARANQAAEENARLAEEMGALARAEAEARDEIAASSYIANVQIAGAWIDQGRLDYALERLRSCPPADRRWEWQWLLGQADNALLEFGGYDGLVSSCLFSGDGTRIVTSSNGTRARVWDVASCQVLVELKGPGRAVALGPESERALVIDGAGAGIWDTTNGALLVELQGETVDIQGAAFSPDGTRIAATPKDSRTWVWDAASGEPLMEIGHKAARTGNLVAFSPDGTLIVTWAGRQIPRLWSTETGELVAELTEQPKDIWSLAFSPDGTMLVVGDAQGASRVWEVETATLIATLQGDEAPISCARLSPDGKTLATASPTTSPSLWDLATGGRIAELEGHTDWVYEVGFSPDGSRVATVSNDNTGRLWDASTGAPLVELRGHTGDVNGFEFSGDGKRILTRSSDGTARLWDAMGSPLAGELEGHSDVCWAADFSVDGRRFVTASEDHTARVWDPARREQLLLLEGHSGGVLTAEFNHDGARIVTSSRDHTARLWDAVTGVELAKFIGHTDQVWSAAFSLNGERVVTYSKDGTARVWDAENGAPMAVTEVHPSEVRSASFDPQGNRIVTACADGGARVFDASTGAALMEMQAREGSMMLATFTPDGNRILTGGGIGAVELWDATSGERVADMVGHRGALMSYAFSPDGKAVVTTSRDPIARLWDCETGAPIAELKGHTKWILHSSFSADGKRILTASMDNTARVWDAATGTRLVELKGHSGSVRRAHFSPDGTLIVTTSGDDTVRVWDAARYALQYAERQAPGAGGPGSIRSAFARELRGEVPPTWLTDPDIAESRPDFAK